jgi:hypothetical protein
MDGLRKYLRVLLAVALAGWLAAAALGETNCCSYCGSTASLQRTCRPIATTRPVEVTGWSADEEDLALPLAGGLVTCNCGGWGASCCASGKCELCLTGGCRACCKVRPRNRLLRKTFLQEVPVVVWVVDYVCVDCAARTARPVREARGPAGDAPGVRSTLDGLLSTLQARFSRD